MVLWPEMSTRPIHPDFLQHLDRKDEDLIKLYLDLRAFVLDVHPQANELLYRTHALTSVYSITEKLGDGYIHIPIYTAHLNLGFNKGTRIKDPHKLLQGTGNLIRHLPIARASDYRDPKVKALVKAAVDFAISDLDVPSKTLGKTISKIK